MRAALLLAALVLVPAAAASGGSAPFTLGPGESTTVRLQLDAETSLVLSLRFKAGVARDMTVDGPGACDLATTATGVGAASMDMARCVLPAGTHAFTLRMAVGAATGSLDASQGRWL